MQAAVCPRRLFQLVDPFPDVRVQPGLIPQHPDAHIVFGRRPQTGLHVIAQKPHQGVHLILGAVPVFRRKGVYRKITDPHPVSLLADLLHPLCSLDMAVISGHSFRLRPSSVSVQDDRHMIRYFPFCHFYLHAEAFYAEARAPERRRGRRFPPAPLSFQTKPPIRS